MAFLTSSTEEPALTLTVKVLASSPVPLVKVRVLSLSVTRFPSESAL